MNIYHVTYVRAECYEMNAVVVAENSQLAVEELRLSDEETDIEVVVLGPFTRENATRYVVAHEQL